MWKKLAETLQDLPEIDKTLLGQKASELGIKKEELNETLALGLTGKRALQKAWDTVLDRFVECGLLVEKNGTYRLAGEEEPEEEGAAEEDAVERDPRLQEVYDRFVGAMARLWQEAF